MRRLWIGTGWKMNKVLHEAEPYLQETLQYLNQCEPSGVNIFLVPPFTLLRWACRMVEVTPLMVGAQNMHWEESGAYTGEVSPIMIKDCGAHLVELGHSERRAMFGETDFTVNKKVKAALANGLRPLVCVGDTALEKQCGVAQDSVVRQVKIALHDVDRDQVKNLVFAYEPVWAIGDGGKPASPSHANSIHATIRQAIGDLYDQETADEVPVIYGGSVNGENAHLLIAEPDIDGLFVGRAAWEAKGFIGLIETVSAHST
ncbi:triose-phosphate isomerase [Thermodesulfobacteriota bacterium]